MGMRYLKFENKDEAEQRSRELWEDRLGAPKKEEDITEFLYSFEVSESEVGGSYLLVDDEGALLTNEEKEALDLEDTYLDWKIEYQPEAMVPD
jgi:hypothetical protein